ncbi:MAG: NUDIX domain-containing protein [Gammaproteobacteria bacterium]
MKTIGKEAVPAAPSATVILTRNGENGVEVLLVRRHRATVFGSADAFPGGGLSEADSQVHDRCRGIEAGEANRRLGLASGGLDFYSAAIRELFEETGVLLARRDPDGGSVDADDASLQSRRILLVQGGLSWSGFLREQQLALAADELHYVSHWETPLSFRSRFSTRFFVAAAPPAQHVRYDGRELVDGRWVSPARALEMGRNAELKLPFPTMKNLESLADFSSLEELRRWAGRRWQRGVEMIRGVVIECDGRRRVVLPGDPDYPGEKA